MKKIIYILFLNLITVGFTTLAVSAPEGSEHFSNENYEAVNKAEVNPFAPKSATCKDCLPGIVFGGQGRGPGSKNSSIEGSEGLDT